MGAYREAPAPLGLPFPRARLGLVTALVIALSAFVVVGALGTIALAGGMRFMKEGGIGMFSLVALAVMTGAALGALGAVVVRGKRRPAAAVAGIPALAAMLGALFFRRGTGTLFDAVSGESVSPEMVLRILALGTAEADAALVLGCVVSACACGAASVALLGSAATLEPALAPSAPPASGRGPATTWLVSTIGISIVIGLRFAMHALPSLLVVVVPSLVVVGILSSVAAGRGPMVRGWHDGREANAWLGAVVAAGLLAAAGLVLVDLTALFATERLLLATIASELLDASQRERIVVAQLAQLDAAKLFAVADASVALAITSTALLPALGRSPDGRARTPLTAPVFVAVGVFAVAFGVIYGVRSSAMTRSSERSRELTTRASAADLPTISGTHVFEAGSGSGPVIRLEKYGRSPEIPSLESYNSNLVVSVDRSLTWALVETSIHSTLGHRMIETTDTGSRSSIRAPLPTVSIEVALEPKPDRSRFGAYAIFSLERRPSSILVSLEGAPTSQRTKRVSFASTDDMQTIVDKLVAAYAGEPEGTRLVVPAQLGSRW